MRDFLKIWRERAIQDLEIAVVVAHYHGRLPDTEIRAVIEGVLSVIRQKEEEEN